MLSMWFKVFVIIFAVLQIATCNFDEFVENEDLLYEDFNNNTNITNPELTTTPKTNHTGIFLGTLTTFTKNLGNILPKFLPHTESTTTSISDLGQLPSGSPHRSLIAQSVSTLVRLPYEGARTAKDLLLSKIGHEGGMWDRNADHAKEHGNLERLGREFVKKVVNTFSRSDTQGLDTNTTFFKGVLDKFKEHVRFIYPGTVWCGEGDVRIRKSTDLGLFAEPDKCCRTHDKCSNYIEKGATKYDLENTGMFTRSHCSCDRSFHDCLKNSKSVVGLQIGITYFTVLGPQCFEETQIIERCDKTVRGRCIIHILNNSEEKKYQWFDNPTF